MLTIVLIDCSYLKVAVAKGSESSLGSNDSGLWRKCSLIKRDVKIKWTNWKKVWNRLYGYRVRWKRRRRYDNAEYQSSVGWKSPDARSQPSLLFLNNLLIEFFSTIYHRAPHQQGALLTGC